MRTIPHLLQGGALGVLVPYGDSERLSRILNELLESPESIAEKTRRAAQIACNFHHLQTMATAVLDVYREALGEKGKHGNDGIATA